MSSADRGASELNKRLMPASKRWTALCDPIDLSTRRQPPAGAVAACYAAGEFRQETDSELHFRYSLGFVNYRVGHLTLSHKGRYVVGAQPPMGGGYPGFSKEPLDAFRHLLEDLQRHCADFLSGSDADFARHVGRAKTLTKNASRLP